MFLRAFRELKTAATKRLPDVVVLVDFPEFNLKLARTLSRRGFKIVYYISPQLWAWRQYRIRSIRNYVDLLISILPFEKDWYAERDVANVEYVGSPLAREVHPTRDKETFCREHRVDPSRPIIALLPGSRHKEIVRIMPVMLEAAAILSRRDPTSQFVVAAGSDKNAVDIDDAKASAKHLPKHLITVVGETFDALNASDAAAVTSGTATLETAIIGTPMAVVYKSSALNYKLLRPLIDVEHFGLVNLIAGERVAKELIQNDFTSDSLAAEIERLLEPDENKNVRERLRQTSDKLGHGGASKRAAELIVELMRMKK